MAFIFCDGFDQYTNNADFTEKGWHVHPGLFGSSADYTLNATGNQWGGQCVEIDDDTTITSFDGLMYQLPSSVDGSLDESIYFGFWVHFETLAAAEDIIKVNHNGTGFSATAGLRVQTDGSVDVVKQSGTIVASTAGGLISTGTWYWICFRVMPKNSTGEVQLWIDGTERITTTVTDLVGSGQLDIVECFCLAGGNGTSNTISFDDIVVWDDQGTDNFTADLGPLRIHTLRPDGTGSATSSTAVGDTNQWECCDDNGGIDSSTYCNFTSTGQDLFACEDLAVIPNTIYSVIVNTAVQVLDSTENFTGRALIREGTTTGTGTTKTVPLGFALSDIQTLQEQYDENPDTAVDWTDTEINGMEIGWERVS